MASDGTLSAVRSTRDAGSIDQNYRYWREHGAQWVAEYEERKRTLVYYHLQEIMLVDFMIHTAPARVLDYGCGVGRHLRNLSQIPGLDLYGYDQSRAMVDGCLAWAPRAWVDQRIAVGEPLQRLPYPDGFFDIVYTSEVLVHVHPDHLERLLAELIRVSRWQVLHIEPSPTCAIVPDAQQGCWNHDLPRAYRNLGHVCEVLAPGYGVQSPYRILLSRERAPYEWSPVLLGLYRQLETEVQPALTAAAQVGERDPASLAQQLAAAKARLWAVAGEVEGARLRQRELEEIAALAGATPVRGPAACVRDLVSEVRFLRDSPSYRWGERLRTRPPVLWWRRWRWRTRRITIEAAGTKHPESGGCQVWLLGVRTGEHPAGLPLACLEFDPQAWDVVADEHAKFGASLMTARRTRLELFAPIDASLRLDFLMHDWSGRVAITAAGHTSVIDLYAPAHRRLAVFPASTPMTVVTGASA